VGARAEPRAEAGSPASALANCGVGGTAVISAAKVARHVGRQAIILKTIKYQLKGLVCLLAVFLMASCDGSDGHNKGVKYAALVQQEITSAEASLSMNLPLASINS